MDEYQAKGKGHKSRSKGGKGRMNEERLKEIIQIAHKIGWTQENPSGYPLMQLSEVEKCMIAMYDDFELGRMRKWKKEVDTPVEQSATEEKK